MSLARAALELFLTPAAASLGLAGNVLSVLVLRHRDFLARASRRGPAAVLVALAAADAAFLATATPIVLLRHFHSTSVGGFTLPLIPALLPLCKVALTASIYLTVAVGVDRFLIICMPFSEASKILSPKVLIAAAVVFSTAYNAPRFFEWSFTTSRGSNDDDDAKGMFGLSLETTAMGEDSDYSLYYLHLSQLVVMEVVPFIVITITSVMVVKAVKKADAWRQGGSGGDHAANTVSQHRVRHLAVTKTLLTIILVFLSCHSLKLATTAYDVGRAVGARISGDEVAEEEAKEADIDSWKPVRLGRSAEAGEEEEDHWGGYQFWYSELLVPLSNWLLVLNSSCNLVVDAARDPRFRDVLWNRVLGRGRAGEAERETLMTSAGIRTGQQRSSDQPL